ncbi:MAG: hypothetical protein ACPGVD_00585 [Flavobacteriales bacterium]
MTEKKKKLDLLKLDSSSTVKWSELPIAFKIIAIVLVLVLLVVPIIF